MALHLATDEEFNISAEDGNEYTESEFASIWNVSPSTLGARLDADIT
jgi:hypothetical protein